MNNQISAETLSPVTHNSIPVITTELLAQLYDTEVINIQVNHTRNRDRFIEGKHFFKLEGAELKDFKNRLTESKSVAKRARSLILWTERGAARHAKMLETDQAWEVFEKLEDCYFAKKAETLPQQEKPSTHLTDIADALENTQNIIDYLKMASRYMEEKIDPAMRVINCGVFSQLHSYVNESRFNARFLHARLSKLQSSLIVKPIDEDDFLQTMRNMADMAQKRGYMLVKTVA